ncbi:restriction endonuclease subunit S [Jiulongibacter sediminis]|uniref:restriction endonuclease subunit S n=1 Tax=Jiulongibacter sediminis TaxID=1605367 RepID=UPI0026EA8592|nr:restriction endonuclease subunit S [Jiulongibacter sediminis]
MMTTYEKYKKSELIWLDKYPEHWSIDKAKYLTDRIGDGLHGTPKYDDEGPFYFINGNNLKNGEINHLDARRISKSTFEEIKIHFNDQTVFYSINGTIGNLAFYNGEPVALGKSVAYLRLRKSINKYYLFYFLQSLAVSNFFKYEMTGTTINNLSLNTLRNTFYFLPPLPEQQAISQYLDTKTQAIDKKVSLLEQKIDYYKELRKSLINDAVTKGLDKTVELKDSGIDWIGEIPEHWEIERFKDSFNLKTGNSISDKGAFEVKEKAHFYISTKDISIDSGAINYDNGLYVPIANKSFKRAKINSTLICIEGANAGKKIGFTEKEVCFVNKLCSIKGKKKTVHDKYHFYFINSKAFDNQFSSLISGLIGGVSINQIKFFNVLMPPIDEQTKIAEYLDEKTATIDKIVQNITDQIDRLKELRKTLINDVVTGKIRVFEPSENKVVE